MEMEWEGIDLIVVNSVDTFHHVVVRVFCAYITARMILI